MNEDEKLKELIKYEIRNTHPQINIKGARESLERVLESINENALSEKGRIMKEELERAYEKLPDSTNSEGLKRIYHDALNKEFTYQNKKI